MAVTEYRLQELSRVSGVSTRNIRASRERGLLDPPRREGRSAYYDAYHLAQLQTINGLLARGFTTVHIAEFFETMRSGRSLADFLGLQRAMLRPPGTPGEAAGSPQVRIDPRSTEGERLVQLGLAQRSGAGLVFADDALGRVISRSRDPLGYAQIVLELRDATRASVHSLSADVIAALKQSVVQRYGSTVPSAGDIEELVQLIADCSEMGREIIIGELDRTLRDLLVTEISDFNATLMTSGEWDRDRDRDRDD